MQFLIIREWTDDALQIKFSRSKHVEVIMRNGNVWDM